MDRQTDRQRVKNSKIYAEKERKYWKIRKKKERETLTVKEREWKMKRG